MAKLSIVKGATSVLVRIFVQDSTSTTGAGKTGLTAASFTGTKVYVARDDDGNANGTAVTLTDATRGTWSSGGIKEKDATNMPGVYEFGLTNASLATGSRSCTYLFIGTGIAPMPLEIELTGIDNGNATTGGLGNLDAAVSGRMATYTQPTGFLAATFPSGTIANQTNITGGTITTTTNLTNLPSIPANWITAAGITAAALNGKGDWLLSSGYTTPPTTAQIATGVWQDTTAGDFTAAGSIGKSVMNGVALGTGLTINAYTGDTPQTGDAYGRLGAPAGASVSADIAAAKTDTAAIKTKTDSLTFTVAGKVDSDITHVNGHAVTGDGHTGTEWGPA